MAKSARVVVGEGEVDEENGDEDGESVVFRARVDKGSCVDKGGLFGGISAVEKDGARSGEAIDGDRGTGADSADKTVDAAPAGNGLPVDRKAVNRDPVGAEPVDVSMVDEDAVAVKPVDESVPAEGAEADC